MNSYWGRRGGWGNITLILIAIPSEQVDHQSQLYYYDAVWVGDKVEPFVTNYDLFGERVWIW